MNQPTPLFDIRQIMVRLFLPMPHIQRVPDTDGKWACVGSGVFSLSTTPSAAYTAWLQQAIERY